MIMSRDGKSFETSDGSEQPHAASRRKVAGGDRAAAARWADDGGPAPQPSPPQALERKPAWSVLSMPDLFEARRRSGRSDTPARLRQDAERAARDRLAVEELREHHAALAQKAERDRYRNVWENT
jgi:hypothetical protein